MSSTFEQNNSVPIEREQTQHALDISIDYQGVAINVLSDYEIPPTNFMELEKHVTGMHILEEAVRPESRGKLIYRPSDEIDISFEPSTRELVLTGPSILFGGGSTLAFIGQYMAECLRASESGILLIHAAAVQSPNRNCSYLILGEKGAGKTTAALRLCHQFGYRLIGNDQVFIGPSSDETLITQGGNAWFNVRETAASADPYLRELIPQAQVSGSAAWNAKRKVEPESIGIDIASDTSPVASIFHVRIDHTQSELYIATWEGTQRNLILHERFGRHISGQATPLQDDNGNYLGSLPPINQAEAIRARDHLVRLAIKAGITEVFAPDSAALVDFIAKQEQK